MAQVRSDYQERLDQWIAERKTHLRVQVVLTLVAAFLGGLGFFLAASVPSVWGIPLWLLVAAFVVVFLGSVLHGWYLLLETLL